MNWIKVSEDPRATAWMANDSPFTFIVNYELDSRCWRARMQQPYKCEIVLVRCDSLEEAERFCEWANRAERPAQCIVVRSGISRQSVQD